MAKWRRRPCIGFTTHADALYLSVENKPDFVRKCEDKCNGCRGPSDNTEQELEVNNLSITYKCTGPGGSDRCGYKCVLLVTEIRWIHDDLEATVNRV
jgi:hypothetical protein